MAVFLCLHAWFLFAVYGWAVREPFGVAGIHSTGLSTRTEPATSFLTGAGPGLNTLNGVLPCKPLPVVRPHLQNP